MADESLKDNNINKNLINTDYILLSPTIDDIPEIKNLSYSIWKEDGIYSDNFYESMLNDNLSYIYKDQEKNIIIAICLALYEEEEDEVNISVLCVKKEYQRKGLGKSILEECIENCVKNRYTNFYLHVAITNEKAIKLYEKIGFRKIKFIKNYYTNDPPPHNSSFLMRLIKYKKAE